MATYYRDAVLAEPTLAELWEFGDPSGNAVGLKNGLPAVYNGTPTRAEPSILPGGEGKSVRLNGTTQYLFANNATALQLSEPITLEVWVVPEADTESVISPGTNGAAELYSWVENQIGLNKKEIVNITQSAAKMALGQPYHLAVTIDGADVHLYMNAVDVTGAVSPSAMSKCTAGWAFGRNGNRNEAHFKGWMQYGALYSGELPPESILEHYEAGLLVPELPGDLPPPRRDLRLVAVGAGGTGRGYDISAEVEDVRWSSVNPGGDERCTFSFKRPWFAENPEIARGNLLRVQSGLDVLWQGRIEERDRSGGEAEGISVTAYGLGARLKDGSLQEIFLDRDLAGWGEPSTSRQLNLAVANVLPDPSPSVNPQDSGAELPAIVFAYTRLVAGISNGGEVWYFGGGVDLGRLIYRYRGSGTDSVWVTRSRLVENDLQSSGEGAASADHDGAAGPTDVTVTADKAGYKYAAISNWRTNAGTVDPYGGIHRWESPIVLGNHGLALRGEFPAVGFTVDQMIGYVVGTVDGVAVRQIDTLSYVVKQASYADPQPPEEIITDVNRFEGANWGTWGPDSPLDNSVDGQFDLTARQDSVQHWFARRADCDELDLHDETSTLYGAVDVTYTTAAGVKHTLRVSVDVPDLDGAGLTRVFPLDMGQGEQTDAQAVGEAFLAVFGQFAPARGSVTLIGALRHHRRGELFPEHIRADGSNLRVPDILPSSTALALDRTPDRRTTFPVKRVEVDASGARPQARVDLDQANDALSILQARLGLSQQLRNQSS